MTGSWPNGLVHWIQVLVLLECGFESQPGRSRRLCQTLNHNCFVLRIGRKRTRDIYREIEGACPGVSGFAPSAPSRVDMCALQICVIMQDMDNGQTVFMVLLDLSAAFDNNYHSILLRILSNVFGFEKYIIDWFKSNLCSRTCRVKIASDFSDPKVLNYGSCMYSFIHLHLFQCCHYRLIIQLPWHNQN